MKQSNVFGNSEVIAKAYGIDLGTTNSAIAEHVGPGVAEIIPLETSNGKTMPSCVMWLGGDNWVVGDEAYKNRHKKNVAYSMKRMIGTKEVVTLEFEGDKRELGAVEFSSLVLKGLLEKAGELYKGIKNVVISVPAHFNDIEIKDTIEAGKIAGLNVISIVREPTAASLVYDTGDSDRRVLVYDLGGGTYDISRVDLLTTDPKVVEKGNEVYGTTLETDFKKERIFKVIKNDGDNRLGGDDVDTIAVNMLLSQLTTMGERIEDVSQESIEQLKLVVEDTKKMGNILKRDVTIDVGGNDVTLELTQNIIQTAYHSVYTRTKKILERVQSPSELKNLDAIALVGGSTKSEILKGFLRRDFPGATINDGLNPDEAVALGASLHANQLFTGEGGMQVEDVVSLGIGVLTGKRISNVVPKNTRIPFHIKEQFVTTEDNQPIVMVDVYQGNSSFKEENVHLGRVEVEIEPGPKGKEVIIHLKSNANGLLYCEATVDGKTEGKPLKNLLGGEESKAEPKKKLSAKERRLIVWTERIQSLPEGEEKEKGMELLERQNSGEDMFKEVKDFMSGLMDKKVK